MTPDIRILQGIPPELLEEATGLLYSAFEEKLAHELRPDSPEQGRRIIVRSLDPALGWIAVDEQGSLLGITGVSWRGRHFSLITFRLLAEEFGLAGAIRRWPLAMLERVVVRSKRLHWRIEVLAVAEPARGKGIGTALLRAVTEAAREAGVRTVGLEVVDVNDRALQLYERVGFTSVANLRTGWLTAGGGYRAVRIMRMELDERG